MSISSCYQLIACCLMSLSHLMLVLKSKKEINKQENVSDTWKCSCWVEPAASSKKISVGQFSSVPSSSRRDEAGGVPVGAPSRTGGGCCCVLLLLAVHGAPTPGLAGYCFPLSLMGKINSYASTTLNSGEKKKKGNTQCPAKGVAFPIIVEYTSQT